MSGQHENKRRAPAARRAWHTETALIQKKCNNCDQDRQCPQANRTHAKPEIVAHAENVALYLWKHNATD